MTEDRPANAVINKKKCPSCGKREATEPHTCPFQVEINGDEETLCECCSECEGECAMDI